MKYIFVKQHDATDCAAACLAMVCLYYKKETTIAKLRDLMGTDLKGTNLSGLAKCADALGFISQAVRVDADAFASDFTLPCIAHIITKEGLTHFIVIYKKNKNFVFIGDPAYGLQKIAVETFWNKLAFTGTLLILKPNHDFVPGKTKSTPMLRRFLSLMLPHKRLFLYSILASLILTALGIGSSLFNKILMDEILPYRLEKTLLLVTIIFGTISLFQIITGFLRQWVLLHLSQKIDIPLLLGYIKHIYKLPFNFFATRKTGDIITRFSDAFTIKDIFSNIALTVVVDISMAMFTGVTLFYMNSQLFMIIFLITLLSIFLVFIFREPYKQIYEEQMQQNARLQSQIIEGLQAIETIKANAYENTQVNMVETEYIKSLRLNFKSGFLSNIQGSVSGLFQSLGNIVLMYFGIRQVINGDTTLGTVMSFMTLSSFFMEPIGNLIGLQLEIQAADVSMKRLSEIFDLDTEQGETEDRAELTNIGDVEFSNVTFRYGNRRPVLNGISFSIPAGKKVAIVGESGSGKSTIAKLLLKYYDIEAGSIKIDGVDIERYDSRYLRNAISYVPQSIELFSKSIYDNIRVSKVTSTRDEVKEAAKLAGAHDFISHLPLRYDTYLQERGDGLSGGEKQRLVLSRAFLKKSGLFILDEATSNLDFATENIIFNTIYSDMKNCSMIIIAHRLATIKNCDQIIVLHEGSIVEKGSHEELLLKQGEYYKLWQMQQGNFLPNAAKERNEQITQVPGADEMTY